MIGSIGKELARFFLLFAIVFLIGRPDPKTACAVPAAPPAPIAPSQIGGELPPTLFDSTNMPPSFQAAKGLEVANVFTSCSQFSVPLTSMMNNLMAGSAQSSMQGGGGIAGMMGASCPLSQGVTINTVCPGSDASDSSSMSAMMNCNMYNPSMVQQMQMQLEGQLCTNECKQAKIQAVQGQLKCLASQESGLSQEAGSLNQVYTSNVQRMQADMLQIKTAVGDTTAKITYANNLLQGNSGSGSQGLLALQQQTQAMLNLMPSQIQTATSAYQAVVQKQNILSNQIQTSQAALTMDCFQNRPVDGYKCDPNGPPQPPMAYLICRFGQNQLLGQNGVVERYDATNKQAQSQSQALSAVLNQIVADAPNMTQVPSTQDQMDASVTQPLLELTPADVESRYGAQLRGFQVGGTNADAFVMGVLQSCQERATATVDLEQQRANTTIGKTQYEIQQAQEQVTTQITGLFNSYNAQYAQDMGGLTGQSMALNTGACLNAPTSSQINCLTDFQSKVQGLLFGSSSSSAMQIQVKGNNPASYVNVSCQGLNGCVSTLQTVSKNLVAQQTNLQNYQTQYALKAFQSTEAFTKTVAASMNAQSQEANQQLQAINSALASLGQSGVNFPPLKGEQLQKDQDGLPMEPTSALNLIGQYVTPPLPDLSGAGDSMSGVAQAQQDIEQKNSQIMQSLVQIGNMEASCKLNRNQQILDQVNQNASGAASGSCWASRYCQPPTNAEQTRVAMQQAVQRLTGTPGTFGTSMNNLNTGIATFCSNPTVGEQDPAVIAQAKGMSMANVGQCDMFYSSLISAKDQVQTLGTGQGGFGSGSIMGY